MNTPPIVDAPTSAAGSSAQGVQPGRQPAGARFSPSTYFIVQPPQRPDEGFDAAHARSRQYAAGRLPIEFVRYFVAGGGAFGLDFVLYKTAIHHGMPYPWAALIGFFAGAVASYLASVTWVFKVRSINSAKVEFGLFVMIGGAGLFLTEGLLWLQIERLGLSMPFAKVGAAGVVFVFNFAVRKALLFRGASH